MQEEADDAASDFLLGEEDVWEDGASVTSAESTCEEEADDAASSSSDGEEMRTAEMLEDDASFTSTSEDEA